MLKLGVILALVSVAYAAISYTTIYLPEDKPAEFADQEGCYIGTLNRVLPYNEPYYPGNACEEYTCETNNQTLRGTCGPVDIHPGCTKSPDDLTKNYPDCCGTEVCPCTTVAPTTEAPTTQAPGNNNPVIAYASAESVQGQPPVTETYTSGHGAQAYATAT